jgi:hypothetical protein
LTYPTWRNNRQYLIEIVGQCTLALTLERISASVTTPLGLYIFDHKGSIEPPSWNNFYEINPNNIHICRRIIRRSRAGCECSPHRVQSIQAQSSRQVSNRRQSRDSQSRDAMGDHAVHLRAQSLRAIHAHCARARSGLC